MHIKLSQASGVPFYRQLEDHIADRIRAGQLAPGAALPSVRQLAAELLVSVITVKRAYEDLEAAGLVVSHQGRGTFVAEAAAAASRAQLEREIAAELARVVRRGLDLGVGAAQLRATFESTLEKP